MNYKKHFISLLLTIVVFAFFTQLSAQTNRYHFLDSTIYRVLQVNPSVTNSAITNWDTAHVVYYNPSISNNKVLLWLTGTTGTTNNIPEGYFKTALEQGYRIIALSFISVPAVSRICRGGILNNNSDCAADFRRRRIYGDNDFSMIPDQPQDAIIPRLVKLLQYLITTDPNGSWQQYLDKGMSQPQWIKIAISGQSQGGGMGQFIAQYENIDRVISFSGGWDYSNSADRKIADWYFRESVTPLEKWYATYNINENVANSIKEICIALNIPPDNVFALDKPLRDINLSGLSNPYHGDGLKNPAYKEVWLEMLGSGLLNLCPPKL